MCTETVNQIQESSVTQNLTPQFLNAPDILKCLN